MKKFPWDCKDCPMLRTYDLSIDDLTHVCLWSKDQIDDCDRYKYPECPLEKHDKEIRADARKKVLDELREMIMNCGFDYSVKIALDVLIDRLLKEQTKGGDNE